MKLDIHDFGDAVPELANDLINEARRNPAPGKNKCHLIHMAVATLRREAMGSADVPMSNLAIPDIVDRAISFRRNKQRQALSFLLALGGGPPTIPL